MRPVNELPQRLSYPSTVAEVAPADMEGLFPGYRDTISAALIHLKLFQPGDALPPLSFPPSTHKNGAVRGAGYVVDEYEITVLDNEQPSGERQDILYVGFLLPHSQTGDHIHEAPIEEAYYIVGGEAIIQGRRLARGAYYATYPYEDHVVRTEKSPALYIIDMKNGGSIPKEHRHTFDFDKSQLRRHGPLVTTDF